MLTRLRSYGADTRSTYPGLRTSATVTAQSLLVSRQFFWVTGRQTTRDTCFYPRVWAQYGCILTMCSDRASIPQMDNFTIKILTTPRICTHCSFSLQCPTVTSSHDTGLSKKLLHDSHNATERHATMGCRSRSAVHPLLSITLDIARNIS